MALLGAALLLLSGAIACSNSGSKDDTPTATPRLSRTQSPTPRQSDTPTPSAAPPSGEAPVRDLFDLAQRYRGYNGPRVVRTEPFNYQVGDQAEFTLLDLDAVESYTVTAEVRAITENAYFFVQVDSPYIGTSLDQVTSDFQNIIWPAVTGAFGEPPTPGIDADPRITILHAELRGAGGYVSGSNEYPEEVAPRSAAREMLYIDQAALSEPGAGYNALVAHELQHLVHAGADSSEDSWVTEGLSEVAAEMSGGSTDGIWEFLGQPDTQLDYWPYYEDPAIHYAQAELFQGYLLDQNGGRENARELIEEQKDSIAGVEAYLAKYNKRFIDTFGEFVVACLLDLEDGPFSLPGFAGSVTNIEELESDSGEGDVSQFGTDYLRVPAGSTFTFDGSEEVSVGIPERDGAFWWSGRGDQIDSRITREVDLTNEDDATLTFDAWFDIEPEWDYAYVSVSEDGGATWTALPGTRTTTDDPVLAAYGPGYTGTDGWGREEVDLGEYAGQEVLLRFEYVTDDATNLVGFAVDNIEIAAIGLTDGADDAAQWTSEGFERVSGPMNQAFLVQIVHDDGRAFQIGLDSQNAASFGPGTEAVTVAISGITRETNVKATYAWTLKAR